jgi:hypothetical protein
VRIPLSYAQERLWFIDQLQQGNSTEYNMSTVLLLRGDLNLEAFEQAIQALVARHEILRTHFSVVDGEPFQVIEPELVLSLPVEDMSALDQASQQAEVSAALQRDTEEPFDLAQGPVMRVKLLKLRDSEQKRLEHIFLLTMHHIVSDGWSVGVISREIGMLYEAFCMGQEACSVLPPLPVQYADFALWQRSWLDGEGMSRGLEHWTAQLAGAPERLQLPADRPRPAVQTFAAEICQRALRADQVAALKQLSQRRQATLYMTLLAAFAVLLERYCGQDDMAIGSPIANRQGRSARG